MNEKILKKKKSLKLGAMDSTFAIIVIVLVSIGTIMVFSASYANAYYNHGNSTHFISKQVVFAVVGLAAMFIISRVDYRILNLLAIPIYGVSILLLIIVLFMEPLNGARRWISIGSLITFQPSEIAKFAVAVLFAAMINANFNKMKQFKYGIFPFLVALAPIVILMVLEPHLSGTVLILGIAAVMMFIGGTDVRWYITGVIIVVMLISVIIANPDMLTVLADYAGSRITLWLDPASDPLDGGFQTLQSLYAIGSGGLMGLGIAGSRQKYLYLPDPHNDFIFAIVCEELGFIGATIIICIFGLLIWRGFVIAMRCPDRFGALVAVGLTSQVAIQTILNIAVVTNTIPNTGISLPFFSYGGTSLIMLLGQMGVILSISRITPIEKQ